MSARMSRRYEFELKRRPLSTPLESVVPPLNDASLTFLPPKQEIGFLDESLKSLHFVAQRFSETKTSLLALGPEDEGTPLYRTSSLCAPTYRALLSL